ncbi:glycosyltransferase [soil metagenome]
MRICYLADAGSIHTRRWCDHFRMLGHEIHLVSFREGNIPGVTFHLLNSGEIKTSGGNWKVLLKAGNLKKILRKIKPDILHAHYATSYGTLGALSGFHPYIITTLGTDVLISPNESIIYRMILKFAFRRADWITAMADHMKIAIIRLGISEKKVSTVMFGIDPKIFSTKNRVVDENKFVITSTRNFEPVYNLELLLDALKDMKGKIPGLEINLIGDGSLRKNLEEKVFSYGLSDIVNFYGKVDQTEIAATLKRTNLFITTSLSDGNNISLNEAMACGVVSIATDIPANRFWMKDGVNGFLVPVDDPLVLVDKILYVYKHYKEIEKSALEHNEYMINSYALFENNMRIVENKYNSLLLEK